MNKKFKVLKTSKILCTYIHQRRFNKLHEKRNWQLKVIICVVLTLFAYQLWFIYGIPQLPVLNNILALKAYCSPKKNVRSENGLFWKIERKTFDNTI